MFGISSIVLPFPHRAQLRLSCERNLELLGRIVDSRQAVAGKLAPKHFPAGLTFGYACGREPGRALWQRSTVAHRPRGARSPGGRWCRALARLGETLD